MDPRDGGTRRLIALPMVRVLERRSGGDRFHFHVLVGGFRSRMAHWGQRWEQLGGLLYSRSKFGVPLSLAHLVLIWLAFSRVNICDLRQGEVKKEFCHLR